MSDTSLPVIVRFDTTANRTAFTPTPGVPEQLYIWLDSDDQPNAYYWDGAAWQSLVGAGTGGISELTGDVTAGPGTGAQAATIAADAVTNAKLANMADQTIKGNDSGGPQNPQDLSANEVSAVLDGATDPFVRTSNLPSVGIDELTGDVTAGPGSGSVAATIANAAVTYAKIQNVTNARLLGNFTGGAAAPAEYSLGAGIEHSGGAIRTKVVV